MHLLFYVISGILHFVKRIICKNYIKTIQMLYSYKNMYRFKRVHQRNINKLFFRVKERKATDIEIGKGR